MTCRDAQRDLPLLAGGDLDDRAPVRELRGHVAACPECRARYLALKSTLKTLSRVGPVEIGGAATWEGRSSLWPSIRRELSRPPAGFTATRALEQLRPWAPFAALTAACALLLVALNRLDSPHEPPVTNRGLPLQPPIALQPMAPAETESADSESPVPRRPAPPAQF